MKRKSIAMWILSVGVVLPLSALADVPGIPLPAGEVDYCRYSQPYTPPAASHRSRVMTCANPVAMDKVALDDFHCESGGLLGRIKFWGVLLNAQQVGRPYYIAIYSDVNCQPDQLLYQTCVIPQVQQLVVDCTNSQVCVFRAQVPPFQVAAGQRYWLQISEDDMNSANINQDDFRWSGRQPIRECPAVQIDADGAINGLIDPCNQQPDDLSFEVLIRIP